MRDAGDTAAGQHPDALAGAEHFVRRLVMAINLPLSSLTVISKPFPPGHAFFHCGAG